MRIGEAAKHLGYAADTLRRLDRDGIIEIPRDRLGHRRVDAVTLEALRRVLYRRRQAREDAE